MFQGCPDQTSFLVCSTLIGTFFTSMKSGLLNGKQLLTEEHILNPLNKKANGVMLCYYLGLHVCKKTFMFEWLNL